MFRTKVVGGPDSLDKSMREHIEALAEMRDTIGVTVRKLAETDAATTAGMSEMSGK